MLAVRVKKVPAMRVDIEIEPELQPQYEVDCFLAFRGWFDLTFSNDNRRLVPNTCFC